MGLEIAVKYISRRREAEELSDAEEQLQRLPGEPMSPPNSQALAMPLPPLKK